MEGRGVKGREGHGWAHEFNTILAQEWGDWTRLWLLVLFVYSIEITDVHTSFVIGLVDDGPLSKGKNTANY